MRYHGGVNRILLLTLLAAFACLLAGPPVVSAQQPSEALQLELKVARKPPVAHPLPDPTVVEKDAEEAVGEIEARERRDELIRELIQGRLRRPDLDRDVIGGIQSRNLSDVLRRR